MDDFIYVLVAGLILIAVALVAFNLIGITAPPGTGSLNVSSFTLGEVGVSEVSYTSMDLGDRWSEELIQKL